NVKLTSAVPVELRYETIVVEDGKLHIYRDVYEKGTNTEENLRAVLQVHGVSLEQLNEQERAQITQALQQMARDPQGNPVDGVPNANGNSNGNANANNNASSASANKKGNSNKKDGDRVTRTIKGQKEIVIEIAALQGKGYPAPVNLDTGTGKAQQQTAAAPRKKGGR
ncbi:MAG TPA: hypothetical protein VM934_02520, partial [Pyrinomonadaceae bacterium]|nr:hypothetical protein [Pyrinomonadaceae bacterium]